MSEAVEVTLSLVLVALALVLAALSLLANRRYHDSRFLFLSLGLIALGAAGVLALISNLYAPLSDVFDIGEGPLIALVLAAALLDAPLLYRAATHHDDPFR